MDDSESACVRAPSASQTGSGDRLIYLRGLSSKAPIQREDVRLLWKKGLVAGLFNIPTEAVFEACTDFCIETSAAEKSKDVIKMMEDQANKNAELTKALRKAVQLGLESRRELEEIMESTRERASQILLLEEQFHDREKQTAADRKKQKTLTRKMETLETQLGTTVAAHSRALDDVKRLESDNKRLNSTLIKTTETLSATQSMNIALEKKSGAVAITLCGARVFPS
jgi:membrane-associated HD superfamily phosphohydrolase